MNNITDEQIMKFLNEQKNFLDTIYDEKQCLGLFVYGKANYGFADTIDDIQTVLCYIPTFEEMCCDTKPIEIFYIKDNNGRKIRICDMRLISELAMNQAQIIMEAVFSEYCLINQRYQKVFDKYIYMNREAIFHCNQRLRIRNAASYGIELLNRYKVTNDLEDIFEACRLMIACELYMSGTSVENCINFKKDYHINYLTQIKNGTITPNIKEVEQTLNNLILDTQDLKRNDSCKDLIRNSIIELMKVALTDMQQDINDIKSILTKTEQKALDIIINNLEDGIAGNISISSLVGNSSISRPVFKNVLQKMKDNNFAEVDNQGVKGTHIKIIDGNLLKQINNK